MGSVLARVHHSSVMCRIYRMSPVIRAAVDKMYGIYQGRGDLMTNKGYWLIYLMFMYLRRDCRSLRKRHIRRMNLLIDDKDVIYINPDRIEFAIVPSIHKRENIEPIVDGCWDLSKARLDNSDTFIALQEHFTQGIPLSDSRCQMIDELYRSIRDVGYKTQKDLGSSDISNEIQVSVDRDGRFLLENGEIHLAIAKILGLSSIPVMVTRRHYQWARFKEEVFLYSQQQPKGAYQMPVHPDLQKIRSHRKEDRWELIVNNLPIDSGTVLDIGSNWGYFCHKFEDLSFECYAVENNYRWLYFLKKLREIENKKFEIITGSVFDIKRKQYDIVLALSIFHHFLRSKELHEKLTKLLGELDMRFMFFEPHQTGHGFKDAYIDYAEDEFVSFVIGNSCLNQYRLLGRTERGRNLYLLSSL